MPRNSFLATNLDNCSPGFLTRYPYMTTIESHRAGAQLAYGRPVMFSAGTVVPLAGSVVANDCYGFVHRPYPRLDAQGTTIPGPLLDSPAGVLRAGYIAVQQAAGDTTTQLTGKPVYVVTVASTDGTYAVGDVCAVSTTSAGGTCVLIDATFMSASDTRKYAEIAFRV